MKANELTIKDLMIGDWVVINNIPRQVTFIDDCLNYKIIARGKHPDSGRVSYVGKLSEEVKPIPLTPETLEKNFESESNIFGLQTYKLNENFNLEDRGDRFCLVRKCSDYNSSTFWICDLMHLHQLQHALRLCGIEKTIEL